MKKIAFLTCESLAGFVADDHLLFQELEGHFEVVSLPWNGPTDWSAFTAVIIRTTWDYVAKSDQFLETLKEIQLSGTKLLNSYSVVDWNIHKFYLRELRDGGIRIVPTVFFSADDEVRLPSNWETQRLVLKPAISATAYMTSVINRSDVESGQFRSLLSPGEWLLQPYVETITQGELSLIYFDKKFSHALMKVPRSGEFRVQEEFGGSVLPHRPDIESLELSEKILSMVDLPLLYARVDLVRHQGAWSLMELELIEPALYFRTHPGAPANFHRALKTYLQA